MHSRETMPHPTQTDFRAKLARLVESKDKALEDQLCREFDYLSSVFMGSSSALFIVDVEDGEFRFVSLNPAHEKLSGMRSEDVAGKTLEELSYMIPPEALKEVRANYQRCIDTGEPFEYEEMIPIGGVNTWWLTRLTPLKTGDGLIWRIVGSAICINRLKATERQLNEANARLEDEIEDHTTHLDNLITEFSCMHHLSLLLSQEFNTISEILQQVVETIARSWNTLTPAHCRLRYNGDVFSSQDYVEFDHVIRRSIRGMFGRGFIEVHAEAADYEFTTEERDLLSSIGEFVSQRISRFEKKLRISTLNSLMQSVLESASDGLIVVDETMRVQYVNEAAVDLLAIAQDKLLDSDLHTLSQHPLIDEIVHDAARCLRDNELLINEHALCETVYRVKINPVKLITGEEQHIVITISDIGELLSQEHAIYKEWRKFRSILAQFPEVLYVTDPETYEVLLVNNGFAEALGADPLGKKCYEAFQGLSEPCPFCTNERLLAGEQRVNWVHHNEKLNKHFFITDQLIDWEGDRKARFEVAMDITQRVEATQRLKSTLEDLARSNRDLEQFAYVASHDLQEPLRMVASYLQLIQRRYTGALDEDADQFIEFAVDGAVRMKQLINDLLLYSRVGRRGAPFELFSLQEAVERVKRNLEQLFQEQAVEFIVGELPSIVADENQTIQLLQNLVSNAVKFHSPDRTPRIEVQCADDGDGWLLTVSDNGIGFDMKYKDRIFEVFKRLNEKDQYPGSGIGLAICRRIVERRDGKIWVESQPNVGTTFYIRLPKTANGDNREE